MDNLYSIGETAKIMGISVQSLRKYSNMGLISPEYVDPQSGYRYFSFNQLHYIDKIKYFRDLGVPLSEIKKAISINNSDKLVEILREQKSKLEEKIYETQTSIENIDWYINYFEYSKKYKHYGVPYITYMPKRYALGIQCEGMTIQEAETQLAKLRHSKEGAALNFLRQYGYVIHYDSLKEYVFKPRYQFMFLKEIPNLLPDSIKQYILEFPEGEYLSFLSNKSLDFNNHSFLSKLKESNSAFAIASEYEKNLLDYGGNIEYKYEILLK